MKNDRDAHDTLVTKLSLSEACKHGYDLVVKHYVLHHNYSQTHIIDAVKIAQSNNQSAVSTCFSCHTSPTVLSVTLLHMHIFRVNTALFMNCLNHAQIIAHCLAQAFQSLMHVRQDKWI